MTPYEELEDAAAQLLDASHTEKRERFSGAPVWTRFAEEEYFALLANAVRRVRAERGDRCRCGATFDVETGVCNRTGVLAGFCPEAPDA